MQAHHVCEMHTQAGMRALMERSFHPVLQTCTGHLRDNHVKEWDHSWICKTHENDQSASPTRASKYLCSRQLLLSAHHLTQDTASWSLQRCIRRAHKSPIIATRCSCLQPAGYSPRPSCKRSTPMVYLCTLIML